MSTEFRRGRGRDGVPPTRPRAAIQTQPSLSRDFDEPEEGEEIAHLRDKYGGKLYTVKELFPDWSDEDILFALQEAGGDLDTAIVRMSEGQTEQWGAVKAKKIKKDTPAVSAPGFSARGGFGDRGGRGRGALAAGRGGRGVARGARGGAPFAATPRAPYTNDASNGTTPASFVAAPAATTAPAWGASAPAPTTPAPTGWGDVAAASTTAAATSDWGAPTEASTTATVGWGDEAPKKNGAAAHERPATPAASAAVSGDGWGSSPAKAKPASKIIAPGAKMSWAQIARPAEPPKPTPPPPPPPIPVAAPAPPPVEAPALVVPEPVVEEPTPVPEPEPEAPAPSAAWNEAPSPGPLDAWASGPSTTTPAPLGVGEGWADAVAAVPEPEASYAHQVLPEVEAHLPPNDIATAGPIEVSTPVPAVEEPVQTVPVAPEPPIEAPQEKFLGAGPPGLGKRASNRPQQEAVVMPSERASGLDIGVQFGSLNLFDGQPSFQQEAPIQQQAPPKQGQSFAQEAPAPVQQYSQEAQHQYQQAQHAQAQQQQHHALQQEQGVQTSFSQPPPNSFAQGNAFLNRYPTTQYGHQHQLEEAQNGLGSQPASSPYAPFKPEAVSSPYFQHPGSQHSHSPAPSLPGQNPPGSQASYGSFNSLPQQAPGQQQPGAFNASQSDYSALYSQDALRNMGFYDQYGQVAQQQASGFQQTASPLPRQDEAAGSAASQSPAPVTPQAQPGQHQQLPGQGQQPYQQVPGQQPYYYQPYGYPGYYNQQQAYPQVPPNYQALQAQYQQQPYGGAYIQQGFPGRNLPTQYAPQPSHAPQGSQHSFRQGAQGQAQGQPGVGQQQQQQQPNPAAQTYANYGYPAAAYDPRAIAGQGQERKDYSSKDLDRSFF